MTKCVTTDAIFKMVPCYPNVPNSSSFQVDFWRIIFTQNMQDFKEIV